MLVWSCMLILTSGGVATSWAAPSLAQCNGIKDLVFVPHMDDDLLFMNPDIQSTVAAGGCLQVVYLTASDRGEGEGYMMGRERGARAAYSYIAQVPDSWTESVSTFGTRHVIGFTLNGWRRRLTLLGMRIKDPWLGDGWGSLTPLSRAESIVGQTAQSIGPYVETYTRADLVATIAAIIRDYQPTTIRHMDDTITVAYTDLCWRCAGDDHPDHIASARLVRDAMQAARGNYAEIGYLNYPSQERETNLTSAEIASKTHAFLQYARNDYRSCADPASCHKPEGPEASWVSRIYYVSRRDAPAVLLPGRAGDYFLFAVGEHNRAANIWQSDLQQWSSLGGRTASPAVAFDLGDGQAGVFVRGANGYLWANTQDPQGIWQGWKALDGARLTRLPAVTAQGAVAAVAMGNDGRFHCVHRTDSDTAWSDWAALPVLPETLSTAAIVHGADGRLAVFAADASGRLWSSSFALPKPGHIGPAPVWASWQRVGEVRTDAGLAAMRNAAGLIELYMRDKLSGHMLRMVQSAPGSTRDAWSAPVDLGFSYVGQPAIGLNESGNIVVAALERKGGSLWLAEGGQAQRLAGKMASTPTLRTIHGTLYVVARSVRRTQDYWVMARSDGEWAEPLLINAPPVEGGSAFHGTKAADLLSTEAQGPTALSAASAATTLR